MNENLRAQLIRDEGSVPHAYQDSLGYWTIGVGRLIDQRKGGKLSEAEIAFLLDNDIARHANELFAAIPWARDLDPVRQGVLINMAFNLGVPGLLKFANTLAAIKARDYDDAAVRMLQSRWADQVGLRAVRLAKQMRTGEWQ